MFRRFFRIESASGIVLLVAAVVALIWANAPFGESYERFWATAVSLNVGAVHLDETLRGVVNDGLMAIFFFVVGMEIKRELIAGDLRDRRTAALPAIAALGGMVVPALVYIAFTSGTGASHGWGIPMATDIAFAMGVVAVLGSRIPLGGRLFLLALAIVDDIGAIVVIAVFYTEQVAISNLVLSFACLGLMWGAFRIGVRSSLFHIPAALAAWFFLLESGVHPTLAGVAIGLLIPLRLRLNDSDTTNDLISPLVRLESAFHPWSSFVIVPIFALANAGVRFAGIDLVEAITHPVSLGVSVGLLVGKTVGITLFAWLAVRFGVGVLPPTMGWVHIVGLAVLAGIGFTVSLFVAGLSFTDAVTTDLAKTGIFVGSLLAGVIGFLILRTVATRAQS